MINQIHLWVVDSGATNHICITLTSMHNIRLCKYPINVTLPNGQQTQVRHIGSVYINSHITLHDVLYIPPFAYNLLSVSKLGSHLPLSVLFRHFHATFRTNIRGLHMETSVMVCMSSSRRNQHHRQSLFQSTTTIITFGMQDLGILHILLYKK